MMDDGLRPLRGVWLPMHVLPDSPAIIEHASLYDGEDVHSYEDLAKDVVRVRSRLLTDGISTEARVVLLGSNSYCFIAVFLGVIAAGATPVLVNNRQSADVIDYIMTDVQPALVLTDDGETKIPNVRSETLDTFLLDARNTPNISRDVTMLPEDIALVLYTSGSTGKPKGVMISHRALKTGFGGLGQVITPHNQPRSIIAAPMFHMNGLSNLSYTLVHGGLGVILPRFDAADYSRALVQHNITLVGGIPTFIVMLEKAVQSTGAAAFDKVRQCILGSAPLTEAIAEKAKLLFPNAVLSNGYGTTEIGPSIFMQHPSGLPTPTGSIGYPASYADVRLGDAQDGRCTTGTLHVRSSASFTCYLNQPETTAEKLVDGWYNTGDVMCRDENGFYFFKGRDDDMFVCNGQNVYPIEIETILERHPQIQSAAVAAKPDLQRGAFPVAFVVLRSGSHLIKRQVQDFALENAPAVMHPREVLFVDCLPLNSIGKVDRSALAQRVKDL